MLRNPRAAATAAAITLAVVVLSGCAARRDTPDIAEHIERDGSSALDRRWSCVPVDGPGAGELGLGESLGDGSLGGAAGGSAGSGWSPEAGRMVSTRVSRPERPDLPGRSSPEDALEDAVAAATEAALGLLEQRGVAFNEGRRRGMVEEAVRASGRGDEIPFPRMSVVNSAIEKCVDREATPPDTCWRAAVRVEYPIGNLRGDANNVRWKRSRAANEARVLRDSAVRHFDDGMWLEGLLDAARVAEAVFGTGLPESALEASPADSAEGNAAADPADTRLIRTLESARRLARSVVRPAASPKRGVVVVETGAAVGADVEFELTCGLNNDEVYGGHPVPAVGVPVIFSMPGAAAVLEADAVTDETGVARCRILSVHGPTGEYELEIRVDDEAVRPAILWFSDPTTLDRAPLASTPVHVVSGAHATTVCFDLEADSAADRVQVTAGFTRRMEREGFIVSDCGPDAAAVITGTVRVASFETEDGWGARALLRASAFDQRTASKLGEATIETDESITMELAGESDADGRRRAEVLALKEAGRLLAVYFEGRILSSGS